MTISNNKNFISISFHKIDYKKIYLILKLLDINEVSIFVDEGKKYYFNNMVYTDKFEGYVRSLNESLLIFDGFVNECETNKEIKTLSRKKILAEIDLGENEVFLIINKSNINLSEKDLITSIKNKQ